MKTLYRFAVVPALLAAAPNVHAEVKPNSLFNKEGLPATPFRSEVE